MHTSGLMGVIIELTYSGCDVSEPAVNHLVTVDRAIAILDAALVHRRVVRMSLFDAAGFRLSEPIVADRDYPPFDKSLMDGFAVRAADVAGSGCELAVMDTIAAGQTGIAIGPGQSAAIMTGAPVPPGADAVVPVEQTTRLGDRVRISNPVRPGNAIARRGSDTAANRVLLESGVMLGPAQIAVAASVGAATVSVYSRPSVAVLSTGDELIDIDRQPTGAQIRNSNSIMLVSLLRQLGCDVRQVAHVRDTLNDVLSAIQSNLHSDAIFVTGGMSMGEFDFVPAALKQLGATFHIAKLRIKPGKPFVYTRLHGDRCHIFGLPGNPVSAYVCTLRLASRILSRFAGGSADPKTITAKLTAPMPANGPREVYHPAVVNDGQATPLSPRGSADIFTLARANSLIVRRENIAAAVAGDEVSLISIG
jgi:molybdopterin molybdotransferase